MVYNKTQQGGIVAASAAIMFAAAATTGGLFSGTMFVAAIVAIFSALALYAIAHREGEN